MEAVFLKLLNMSLSAAVVIAAVVLVRLALLRAPKKWRYALWIVVAFRLLCPVSIEAPFSVLRLTAQPAVTQSAAGGSEIAYIPQDIGYMAQPRVYVSTPRVSQQISQSLPAPAPTDSANPLQIWIAVGTALWCAGMAALLLYGIVSYLLLRRRLTGAVLMEEGVRVTDAARSPFILGLVRPVIYLPPGLSGETLRYVLAHERFHIRRGDHAVKVLAFVLLTLHWFNPMVWLAFWLMCRDMEMRCDEAVLARESGITKPYSMVLLSFAAPHRFPSPSPLCFGETGVKERIKNVLRWKKPKVWVTVCAALLCACAVAACAVNPSKETGAEGTPWDWTSTVQLSDVKGFAEGNGLTLRYSQMQELIRLLNAVRPEEVVRGRGIPSNKVLDITTGVGYRLRWGGGIIELDFDDNAAAAELYGSPDAPGPGVWEIHNDALYAFLDGLEAAPAPASGSDLDGADTLDWGPNLSPDGHMYVQRFDGDGWYIYIPVSGWTLEEASEVRTKWTSDAGTGSTLVVRRASAEEYAAERPELADGQAEKWVPAGDGGYWLVFTQYNPMLRFNSSWLVAEPVLLERMAYSFRIVGVDWFPRQLEAAGYSAEALSFRNADGRELCLNMELMDLNTQMDTMLAYGYFCDVPQHAFGAAAVLRTDNGMMSWPVVMLRVSEGWEISDGPGVGATAQAVEDYWGAPSITTDVGSPPPFVYMNYELDDGWLTFVHRGDGVITAIELTSTAVPLDEIGVQGNLTYLHGRGSAHIKDLLWGGELYAECSAMKQGSRYRMALTAADGTETVLLEGEGTRGRQENIPLQQDGSGSLDVEIEGDGHWVFIVNWAPGLSAPTMQPDDPALAAAQRAQWAEEVNMIGEEFVSEAGEAGEWLDVRTAFAERWCEKYLNASAGSPFACDQGGILELGTWLDGISLTGRPRRLAFNVSLSLHPLDEAALAAARVGWVNRTEDGRCIIQTEAVLRSDDGVRWTVEALNSGGSGGWGYRTRSSVDTQAEIDYALSDEDKYGIHLLRFLPNLDWTQLSADQFNKVSARLRAAALKTDELDLGPDEQLIRDLYMLWGFRNTDGAYAALFLDGADAIFAIQYRADPDSFRTALAEMDAQTQQTVRLALGL